MSKQLKVTAAHYKVQLRNTRGSAYRKLDVVGDVQLFMIDYIRGEVARFNDDLPYLRCDRTRHGITVEIVPVTVRAAAQRSLFASK